jgi:ABC-2 type transport system permease protein
VRAFLDVLRFELRMQCTSPLFVGVLFLFFSLHLLTIGEAGINLNDNDLIFLNSASQIFRTELVLGVFGMLPAAIFVVNAMVRDYERSTVELFFTTPVGRLSWLFGRFAGGTLCALGAALAGLLGTVAGTFMPWVEPGRLAPFDAMPYVAAFAAVNLPNMLLVCVLCFSLAALSRSQAWTFAAVLGLVVYEVVINNAAENGGPAWLTLPLLDPMGGLPISDASRYWTVAELNTRLPVTGTLLVNRVVWLAAASALVAFTAVRFRLDLARQTRQRPRRAVAALARELMLLRRPGGTRATRTGIASPVLQRFTPRDTVSQFAAQVRADARGTLVSPLFGLILLFTIVSTASEFSTLRASLMGLPLHPVTGLILGFFRYGLLQFVLVIQIYYSATLVFREREHGLAEIVGATPHPDWLMVSSKTLTLGLGITLVLLVSMATSMALQLAAGHEHLDVGVYLQGLFVYNGVYFYMLCVLAVFIQVISPGKWSGMVLLAVVMTGIMSLEALGFEHVLYGFRIPYVVYSDMNGFGHFRLPTFSLIAYWAPFCFLLLALGHVLYPRGTVISLGDRLRSSRARITPSLSLACSMAALLFVAGGVWIFWNTNVLNRYETTDSLLRARAEYERRHASWKNAPTPAFSAIAVEVDLYPDERRLESRGRATLTNRKSTAIGEFVVSTDPRLRVNAIAVDGATVVRTEPELGFRLLRLAKPLQPGDSVVMTWDATRVNRGFVNSSPDNEIVANGTFVELGSIVPIPAYDEERELTDPGERRRTGLPPADRLPALGDPAWLNVLGSGVDGRSDIRVVVSTAADQIAVSSGALTRQWEERGRRHFEYVLERPVWPRFAVTSARYAVARDRWNDVALEVYHDPRHPWNVGAMLQTAKRAMEYYGREYAPYPLSTFRILEYPRYRTAAQAFAGMVPYSEMAGFLSDLRGWAPLDYATAHELAHQWWGGFAYGAKMQGRQMLNETMAQYSTLMLFKQLDDPQWLRRILAETHRIYLQGRSRENVDEQPLMYTEDQGNISYNKGALVMFALQDLIGPERMHEGLRNYLKKFGFQAAPYPTSRDLVNELRAVAGPEHQQLITDLFERIVLYDVAVTGAAAKPVGVEYEVTIDVSARQLEADGHGAEREVPLDAAFDLVLFPASGVEPVVQTPIYQQKHRLRSGSQRLVVRVPKKPAMVGVDPFHLMIDRTFENNVYTLPPG